MSLFQLLVAVLIIFAIIFVFMSIPKKKSTHPEAFCAVPYLACNASLGEYGVADTFVPRMNNAADSAADNAAMPLADFSPKPGACSPDHARDYPPNDQSLIAAIAKRNAVPGSRGFGCSRGRVEIDSAWAGPAEDDPLPEELCERMRSNAAGVRGNDLTAINRGLGFLHRDPRFEPGPNIRYFSGDTSPAPGNHAGSFTYGALAPSRFMPVSNWDHGRLVTSLAKY